MNRYLTKVTVVFTVLALIVPLLFSFPSSALEDLDEDQWAALKTGYMSAGFDSVDDRIKGNDVISAMELVYEKNGYALYADLRTGEMICLKLIPDGNGGYLKKDYEKKVNDQAVNGSYYEYECYWTTNPYNIGTSKTSSGGITSESEKLKLYSQVNIGFSTISTGQSQVFYSFGDAAMYNQITVKKIKNGVRSEYILGKQAVKNLVPQLITKERMDLVIERMKAAGIPQATIDTRIYAFYHLYETVDENTDETVRKTRDYFDTLYPECKDKEVFELVSNITQKELQRLEDNYFKKIGYTFEEVDEAHNETGFVAKSQQNPLFKLAIEYGLDDDGLAIRCNAANIRFDTSKYSLDDVFLLPNSGAGDVNNEGFILMPDGSGSTINFKSVKNQIFDLTDSVYGQDYAFSKITGANKEIVRLPVYGLVETIEKENEDKTTEKRTNGYLAIITEGDTLSRISMKRESTSSYARAYTIFNPRPKDEYMLTGGLSVSSTSKWVVEAKRKYVDNYRIKICLLSGEKASYAGMAEKYREYLYSIGALSKLEVENGSDIPLFLETLGSIDTTKRILGVPVGTKAALTTFGDTVDILEKLKTNNGIKNIALMMSGWANGGMTSTVPSEIDIEEVLGGEKGFRELVEYAKNNSIQLFPNLDFAYSYKDEAFDGFSAKDDLSKTIDNRNAYKREYQAVTQSFSYVPKGIISANSMSSFYEKTFKEYSGYDIGGIGVTTLGETLSSDFDDDNPLNREDARTLIVRLLEKIKEDNGKVLLAGGNAYTLKYGSHFINVPLENSMYRYASASIPFYGMVLHGSKEFTGTALNLSGNFNASVLKIIENGASPYFVFAMQNTSQLKNIAGLSQYYSIRYTIWYDDLVKAYNTVNNALKDVRTAYVSDYKFMDDSYKVIKVTYDNGITFYINYLYEDTTVIDNGSEYTIGAESFIKTGADGKVIG